MMPDKADDMIKLIVAFHNFGIAPKTIFTGPVHTKINFLVANYLTKEVS
jgi:hypothetical protein